MFRSCLFLTVTLVCAPPCLADTEDFGFAPGVLQRDALIRAVLERNPEIETTRHALRAAVEQQSVASALEDPRLSYGLAPLSVGGDARFGNVLSVSQRFPYPGKLPLRERVAQAQAEAVRQNLEVVRLDLALLTSELFSDYYYVHRAIEINHQHVELLERFKRIATARYSAGLAAQQDPIQAEVELAHLEHRSVVLESHREVLVARINALLHRPPSAPLPVPPESLPLPVASPREGPEKLESAALQDRAELRAQDSTIRAWEADRELKQKDLRPDFEATTSWNSMWNTSEHRWMVGASINLPVRRKRVRASIARTETGWHAARSERRRLEDEIRVEVQEARVRVRESRHVVELYRSRLLPASGDQVRAALSGFETGGNSFLAVIEAERNQRTTELGFQQSLADLHQRLAELDRAVGRMPGALESESEAPTPSGVQR